MTPPCCVLVLAEPTLRDTVELAARLNGYVVLACRTPLEAIQLLELHSRNIGYAILSSAAPQALELRELLADEYPAIQQFVLST
jgi:hypothetical protein